MLLYPKSLTVIANAIAAATGIMEVIQQEAPLTLFVWGPQRVLPVRIKKERKKIKKKKKKKSKKIKP